MEGFAEGYSFFEKNSGSYTSAAMGNAYVQDVADVINILRKDLRQHRTMPPINSHKSS